MTKIYNKRLMKRLNIGRAEDNPAEYLRPYFSFQYNILNDDNFYAGGVTMRF
jgi:regulatory protein YycH of two-component signal transduction system YycFG